MPRILVLDTSSDFLKMVLLIFKQEKMELATCHNFAGLFAHLQQQIPDLLILDTMHHEITGATIQGDLRTRNALKLIPILITSTKFEHIRQYRDVGADDGLLKPFDALGLVNKVKALLERSMAAAI